MVENNDFKEYHTESSGIFMSVSKLLYSSRSKLQTIEVFENIFWGRVLILDGCIMLTERDEFIYHEMLVHPAMLSHPSPDKVLVVGGGDGGSLREVLKHSVKEVTLVEIDNEVINISKKFFPSLASAFEDKRVKTVIADGKEFVLNTDDSFDVIIIDSQDPVGKASALFDREFYRGVLSTLKEKGIMVAQMESPYHHIDFIKGQIATLRDIFNNVWLYTAPVPTYPGGFWCFVLSSLNTEPFDIQRQVPAGLRYYNLEIHRASFALPSFLKNAIR